APSIHNFCDPATGGCTSEPDPSAVCTESPPFGCPIGLKCCRLTTSPGAFAMACRPITEACDDGNGIIGTACGEFVCPLQGVCCGGTDCCTSNDHTCFEGVCRNCVQPLCGGNKCCDRDTEICVSGTCQPRCGTGGPVCVSSQQCCPALAKCCDATSQECGVT